MLQDKEKKNPMLNTSNGLTALVVTSRWWGLQSYLLRDGVPVGFHKYQARRMIRQQTWHSQNWGYTLFCFMVGSITMRQRFCNDMGTIWGAPSKKARNQTSLTGRETAWCHKEPVSTGNRSFVHHEFFKHCEGYMNPWGCKTRTLNFILLAQFDWRYWSMIVSFPPYISHMNPRLSQPWFSLIFTALFAWQAALLSKSVVPNGWIYEAFPARSRVPVDSMEAFLMCPADTGCWIQYFITALRWSPWVI